MPAIRRALLPSFFFFKVIRQILISSDVKCKHEAVSHRKDKMPMKKTIFLSTLLTCLALENTLANVDSPPITRDSLEKAFAQKEGALDALIKLFYQKVPALQKKLQSFGDCNQNGHKKNWITWRNAPDVCGTNNSTPDEFRRNVIKSLEDMTIEILEETQLIPASSNKNTKKRQLSWLAIGTPGAMSDIDTVAQLTSSNTDQKANTVPKIVAEVRAKSIFDALNLSLYGQPTNFSFDTESYIDVTDDLAHGYLERIKSPLYQSLAITLAFTQIARQLSHGISMRTQKGESLVYTFDEFQQAFAQSSFAPLLEDGNAFAHTTAPRANSRDNIAAYLPIINSLATEIAKMPDDLQRAKLKGMLGTYFPESYFARESLAHVCYSDDSYSQLLLTLINQYRKNNGPQGDKEDIPPSVIEEFKKQTITPNAFIYTVSALENLGYFFHKLDHQERAFEAFKNASKYFFRITRALAGYWGVQEESMEAKPASPEAIYVSALYQLASQLERLKRGFLPFSSTKYIESVLKNVNKNLSDADIKANASTLYTLYHNIYLSRETKRQRLQKIAESFQGIISYDTNLNRFDVVDAVKAPTAPLFVPKQNKPSALSAEATQNLSQVIQFKANTSVWELVSLMNLAMGVDNDPRNLKIQKIRKDSELQTLPLPMWNAQKLGPIGDISNAELKAFLQNLVSFMKHTLEDFAKKHNFTPKNVALNTLANQQIARAVGEKR